MKENNLIPNDVTYGCLIDACIKKGNFQKALQVFQDMKKGKVKMNTIIYTTLIKGYAKEYMLEEALALYSEYRDLQFSH
jgi:pentatricopeptide repeat protein